MTEVLGPLLPLALGTATDVLVNGPGEVWVDGPGGLRRTGVLGLDTEAQVRVLAQRLAAAGGRRLDDAAPWVDVRLPGGIRVHAVLATLCRTGTHISLRIPRPRPPSLADLVAAGSIDAVTGERLVALAVDGEGLIVSGVTGSGKTTVLAAVLGHVPLDRRIVVVEDAAELRVDHPHVVHLEARRPNVEGAGAVELDVLVRQALRMRPDHLVVGEVRGVEVRDLLAALTTGHSGATTLHARSADAVPDRVAALAEGAGLQPRAALRQLRGAVTAVVHVERLPDGFRRVAGVWGWDRAGRVIAR